MALAERPVTTMLPVSDAERAKEFYSERLGLPYRGSNGEGSLMYGLAGGLVLMLLPRPGMHHEHTTLSFEVDDLPAEIADLESRGVVFEDYDLPELTTVDHIADLGEERAAWFLDPDGNVLCVHSFPR